MAKPESVSDLLIASRKSDEPAQFIADWLRGQHFTKVCILDRPSIPSVLSGFILTKLGIINPNADLVVRTSIPLHHLSTDLQHDSWPLYHPDLLNPAVLQELIKVSEARHLDNPAKARLRRLATFSQSYRKHQADWWQAGSVIDPRQVTQQSVHEILSIILWFRRDNPEVAYERCQQALDRLMPNLNSNVDFLAPISVEVPVLKNGRNEPDRVENATFDFDPRRLLLLTSKPLTIVIGGPPNVGKSTVAVSLYKAMQSVIQRGRDIGILGPQELSVSVCDLDLASPTALYLLEGQKPPEGRSNGLNRWTRKLMSQALDQFHEAQGPGKIVIGDLPGGVSQITSNFVAGKNFSMRVESLSCPNTTPWEDFLMWGGEFTIGSLPIPASEIYTRLNEPARVSGAFSFESRTRKDDKREFLKGQVVDLNRVPKPDDPFIQFAAYYILGEVLPWAIMSGEQHGSSIFPTLGLDQPRHIKSSPEQLTQLPNSASQKIESLIRKIDRLPVEERRILFRELQETYTDAPANL